MYFNQIRDMKKLLLLSLLITSTAYSQKYEGNKDCFPKTDQVMYNVFWVGLHPSLTKQMSKHITESIKKLFQMKSEVKKPLTE